MTSRTSASGFSMLGEETERGTCAETSRGRHTLTIVRMVLKRTNLKF